jgi:hypothetical protein
MQSLPFVADLAWQSRRTSDDYSERFSLGKVNSKVAPGARVAHRNEQLPFGPSSGFGGAMMPRFSPIVAACVRSFAPNLDRMLWILLFTVSSVIES